MNIFGHGPVAVSDQLSALLTLVSDPAASKARIAELRAAETAATTERHEANLAKTQASKLHEQAQQLLKDAQEQARKNSEAERLLENKALQISTAEARLYDKTVAAESADKARDTGLRERADELRRAEAELKKSREEAVKKAAELAAREATITKRENRLKAALGGD
jgi:hypothetical protein